MTKQERFQFIPTRLAGLLVVDRKPILDERGSFCRFFCSEEFKLAGLRKSIAQMNHTCTRRVGTVRGLHFQYPPHAEYKIVTCLKGRILDVAVDIRKASPTFLQWHGEVLSDENRRSLLIPEGFAHGFQTLTDDCEMLYLHSSPFEPSAEGGLHVADPKIGIDWPLAITHISERDRSHAFIDSVFEGIS